MLVSKSVLSIYEDIVQYQPPWINRNPSTSSANTKPLLPDLDTTRSVSSTSTTDLPDNFSMITDSSIFSKKVYFSFDFLFFSLQKVFDLAVVKKLLKKTKTSSRYYTNTTQNYKNGNPKGSHSSLTTIMYMSLTHYAKQFPYLI